jgi:hypothetical protein
VNVHDLLGILSDGQRVRPSGGGWMIPCPGHDDTTPSLSIAEGNNGEPVMKCFAGCDNTDILATHGLTWAEVLGDEDSRTSALVAGPVVYEYRDAQGKAVFEVVRLPNKQFRQRQRNDRESSGYQWNLRNVQRVLYHLPDVIRAVNQGDEVWITEGEKDADAVRERGVCATTNSGGAGKWLDSYTEYLADASVTIWADADEPGRTHARNVREALLPVAGQVRIVEAEHGQKDAYAHFLAGYGLDDVLVTVPYNEVEVPELFMLVDEFIDQDYEPSEWVMPTLLKQKEVLVLTGFEGMGKSSLMKQFAVCAGMGIHPFVQNAQGAPCRVLYIDYENNRDDIMEDFARLRRAGREQGVWHEPVVYVHARLGMDLARAEDLAWLIERVNAHQPDLLVIGPITDMVANDLAREETVRALKYGIRRVQQIVPCAVILEHHAPHQAPGEARKVRPIGSSLLMRWPSFGFGLLPSDPGNPNAPFEFEAWRGARRRGRSWPDRIEQGVGWFWVQTE